jgi:hypothetical protein
MNQLVWIGTARRAAPGHFESVTVTESKPQSGRSLHLQWVSA